MYFVTLSICCTLFLANYGAAQALLGLDCPTENPIMQLYLATDTHTTLISPDYSNLDFTKRTFFVIHGWNESSTSPEYPEMARDLYLETRGNVILVDYTKYAKQAYIPCVYKIVEQVGNAVSNFIIKYNIPPKSIHIIGHSLGGQVAGQIGKNVRNVTGTKISRISALDPAGPLFSMPLHTPISLSAKDAQVVDVTHVSVLFGSMAPGTVDFVVNGIIGLLTPSPNCSILSANFFCKHQLSKTYFRKSIRSCSMQAISYQWWCRWCPWCPYETATYGFYMNPGLTGEWNLYPADASTCKCGHQTCA